MNTIRISIAGAVAVFTVICSMAVLRADPDNSPTGEPVLLELFTSEGCSSCPPADDLLIEWEKAGQAFGVPVVCLSYHVDYWNNLGWTDPWSSSTHTLRQSAYNRALKSTSNYTPQLVVDGAAHTVGSNGGKIAPLVRDAAKIPKVPIRAQTARVQNGIEVVLNIGQAPAGGDLSAILAVATVLDHTASDVSRGENASRKLRHSAVVTSLHAQKRLTLSANAQTERITLPADGFKGKHLVFFLQNASTLQILGTTKVKLPQE